MRFIELEGFVHHASEKIGDTREDWENGKRLAQRN
jgi:hypothetical protein